MSYISIVTFFFIGFSACLAGPKVQNLVTALASLTDPAKLATLKGERAANPRLQKCVYWLAYAEEQGQKPQAVLDESAMLNKTEGTPYAGFVRWGFFENIENAKDLRLSRKLERDRLDTPLSLKG